MNETPIDEKEEMEETEERGGVSSQSSSVEGSEGLSKKETKELYKEKVKTDSSHDIFAPSATKLQNQMSKLLLLKYGALAFFIAVGLGVGIAFIFEDGKKDVAVEEDDGVWKYGDVPNLQTTDEDYRLVPDEIEVIKKEEVKEEPLGSLYEEDEPRIDDKEEYLRQTGPLASASGSSGSGGSGGEDFEQMGKNSPIGVTLDGGEQTSSSSGFSGFPESKVGIPNALTNAVGGGSGGGTGNALSSLLTKSTPYDLQNSQGQKSSFMSGNGGETSYVGKAVQSAMSPNEIKAGTIIPLQLISRINSDLPGEFTAIVSRDVYDAYQGKRLLLPAGTRLIGRYDSSVSFGQKRVLAYFYRIIRADGQSLIIPNFPAVDRDGTGGMKARVQYHLGSIGLALGLGTLANLAVDVTEVAVKNLNTILANAINQAGETTKDVTDQIVEKLLNKQPTLTVESGTGTAILITKDMIWPPVQ